MILAISRQPGTNTVEVVDNIKKLIPEFRHEIPPAIELETAADTSDSIRGSIHDVEFTLLLTICIVIMVIFLFLRNVSATLIPGAAVPFSIIGTFAVMYLLGYSLNNLSLMALTLSVGFVVDDAIVMLENIVRHMEMGKSRMEAALAASREIGFTIISMTLSLVAVFIPVLFMAGIVGRLLHEFSVTIVVAILISGFVSLTLTPMLGSRFLKSEHGVRHGRGYHFLEGGFNLLAHWYERSLAVAMRFRLATLTVAVVMLAGTVYLFKTMPTGFIPSQDSGFMFGIVMGPQDISFESMARHLHAVEEVARAIRPCRIQAPWAALRRPEQPGVFLLRDEAAQPAHRSVDQVIEDLRPKMMAIPGVLTFMQNPPPITVSGQFGTSIYQLTLQSPNLEDIYTWAPKLTAKMQQLPGFVDVNSDLQIASPQVMVDIDRDRTLALGVTPQQVQDALYSAFGTRQVSVIYAPADQYSVIMEVLPKYQQSPEALSKLYVRSSSGSLVPLDAMVHTRRQVGPLSINHFGQLPPSPLTST